MKDESITFLRRDFAGESDLELLHELATICEEHDLLDEHFPVSELRDDFIENEPGWGKAAAVWFLADRIIAAAAIWAAEDRTVDSAVYGWYKVHPEFRIESLLDEIIVWLDHATAEFGGRGAELELGAREQAAWKLDHLRRVGFEEVRRFLRMSRVLNQPIARFALADGYAIRPIIGESELPAWIDAFNGSFVDHWGFVPDTVERRLFDLRRADYRADWDLVAVAPDGSFAGFCWLDSREPTPGVKEHWVHLLGTHRDHRRRGLASALLAHGLTLLKDDGAEIARLSVDQASQTGATTLYRRNGFTEDNVTIVVKRPVNG